MESAKLKHQKLRWSILSLVVLAATFSTNLSKSVAQVSLDRQPWSPAISQESELMLDSAAQEEESGYSLALESPLVLIDALVTDADGNVLTGLQKDNFRIFDNGQPRVITGFSPVSAPLTLVILLEYSGISYNYFAYKSADWTSRFLDNLEENAWIALVTYDMRPTVQVDFTRSRLDIAQALRGLSYPQFGEANLFDALIQTLDQFERVEGKKSILVIGTGVDTFSKVTLDDVYKRLKKTDATIFAIGVAESEVGLNGGNIGYLQIRNQLQTFANLTGGFAWFPRFEGELPDIFQSVGGTLRNQYSLSFSPPKTARDGKYHKLKIEVIAPDGSSLRIVDKNGRAQKVFVYAREGYTAPANTL
jgi:VWFA-related protein